MSISIIDSVWTGPTIRGNGLTQLVFGEPTTGTSQDAADAVQTFWAGCASAMSNNVTVQVQSVVRIFDESSGVLTGTTSITPGAAVTGVLTGENLPPANQYLCRWVTATIKNNRIVRGRTFLPGTTADSNQDMGIVEGALITDLQTAQAALIADPDCNFGIWSRPVAGSGGVFASVTAGTVWSEFAVLRSRRD